MSLHRLAADLVLVVHLGFILFVVFGGFLALRRRWVAWIHLPVAAYGAAIELVGWVCPLTPLENRLRRAAGQEAYEGGFIEHYLVPLIYPSGLTPGLQLALGAGVVLINAAVYWLVFRRPSPSGPA